MRAVAAAALLAMLSIPAEAHDWYTTRHDPVFRNSCCGGSDCAAWKIEPGEIVAEPSGYRVRLPLDHAVKINRYAMEAVDALVIWDRVQVSEDGGWHLCIGVMSSGPPFDQVYCLFAPPNT